MCQYAIATQDFHEFVSQNIYLYSHEALLYELYDRHLMVHTDGFGP